MANLPESPTYDAGVYQIETTDAVLGGPTGPTNLPLKNLANRTAYLKQHVDALEDGSFVPAGIATQAYVQGELQKLDHKQSVRAATTANITLTGTQTIDGVVLAVGNRVLVKNQASAAENGIYLVSGSAWTRATDADSGSKLTSGTVVAVEEGTLHGNSRWQLTTDGTISVGTTPLVFADVTSGFAPLASPTFIGNPAAPTPAQFDNDTRLATTEFVQRALGNLQSAATFTGNQTLTAADAGKMLIYGEITAATVTLPAISTLPATSGAVFEFLNTGTATLTVQRAGSDQIDNGNSSVNSIDIPPNMSLRLVRSAGSSLWHAVTFPAASLDGPFASARASSGYQRLPSGLIIQWGTATTTASGAVWTAALPIAFPNAHVIAVANAFLDNSAAVVTARNLTSVSGTSITDGVNSAAGVGIQYISIGY